MNGTPILPVTAAIGARAAGVTLTAAELGRYSRHVLLPEVGEAGQRRLKAASVLVIGAGGLGSPVSLYLAAAGVGRLGLVDHDRVEASNLQRQILYGEQDAGRPKLAAAAERLKDLNAGTELELHGGRFNAGNAERLVRGYDVVVDGTDNFSTRYLANDVCVRAGVPYIYGSIYRFDGQASVFYPPHGPCYRCLFPAPPPAGKVPSCAEGGVLGVLPGHIGMIQATETLKLLLGIGEPLLGRLMAIDALTMRVEEFRVRRDPACPACGERPRETIDTTMDIDVDISVREYREMREKGIPHVLVDVRSVAEAEICRIEGSVLIPLPELEERVGELPRDKRVIVYCKGGARSGAAVGILKGKGFGEVKSLEGGILRWIEVDRP